MYVVCFKVSYVYGVTLYVFEDGHNSVLVRYDCLLSSDFVEGAVRLTEARLRREVTEGKIVDFRRVEGGFEIMRVEAVSGAKNKVGSYRYCTLL